ncbi:MAG: TonB domain protein [Betaproteobacteria bacterium]|nr:TonB domain protein [Betaproteobacteria bacterium]
MTLRACATAATTQATAREPRKRLLAAVAVSALLHASLCVVVTGGARRIASVPAPRAVLAVRIVPDAAPGAPEILPASEIAERTAPRVERAVPRPAPAAQAVSRRAGDVAKAEVAAIEAPDTTYYAAKQLDVYPALESPLDLRYGGKAAADGISGRALLLVMIDESGMVKDVSVVEAEPADYFENDAKRAFMSARFSPAYRNGRPVRSRVLVQVNYGVERASP